VGFQARRLREEDSSSALVDGKTGRVEALVSGRDFTFRLSSGSAASLEAPLVFAGYGLSIPEVGHEDFAGLDLRGKIVVYLMGAPSSIPGPLAAHSQSHRQRWEAMSRAGAVGIIRILDPIHREVPWERIASHRLAPSMGLEDPALDDSESEKISMTFNPESAEKLFAGSGLTFAQVVAAAKAQRPLARQALAVSLRMKLGADRWKVESDNVVGIRKGSDPVLSRQYVVLTAHLDHLGIGAPVAGDSIYNGAMDNASGVATLLEVAEELHESRARLQRSVIFLVVTGEEKGLLGSEYFAAHPTVPIGSIVANINVDMFLPLFPLKLLTVEGLDESDLGDRLTRVARPLGVATQPDPHPERNYFIRSDQYNFILKGIPAVDFEVGAVPGSSDDAIEERWISEHYHAPSDDTSRPVDLSCAAAYNRIVLALTTEIADDPARPRWKASSFFRRFAPGNPTD
jgi:hypothetical protein